VLHYPEDFGPGKRETTLQGAAFFHVTHDASHPFTVAVKNARIEVLGTSFAIREEDASVSVAVNEGVVKMITRSDEGVVVKGNERAVLTTDGHIQQSQYSDPALAAWRQHSNADLAREKSNPELYLSTHFTWRKNAINQSVIEGTISNAAAVTSYKNIVLKVTYQKPNGRTTTTHIRIPELVRAGENFNYQKRLLDIFTDTKSLRVEIEKAEAQTNIPH